MRHNCVIVYAFIAFTLLVRRHEEHLAVKIELWVVGMVICHGQDADCLPMPLPSQNPIISCLSKIQNGSTFLVLAYQGCPGKQAVRWVFLFMISLSLCFCQHFYEIILHLVHKWSLCQNGGYGWHFVSVCSQPQVSDVFIGYRADTAASIVLQVCHSCHSCSTDDEQQVHSLLILVFAMCSFTVYSWDVAV